MTPPALDILLVGDAAEADRWLTVNLGWIDPARDTLGRIPRDDPASGLRPIIGAAGPGHADPIGGRAILLADAAWGVRADWRDVLARIAATHDMDSATGRLLDRPAWPDDPSGHVDLTPGLIADRIVDWSVDPRLHAIACSALPGHFLWIAPRHAARLRHALDVADGVAAALRLFQADDGPPGGWRNLYLPDLVAFRIREPAAA